MAQPIKRSAVGAVAEATESGLGGGLIGGLAGILGGGLIGAAAVALVGAVALGAVGALGGVVLGVLGVGESIAAATTAGAALMAQFGAIGGGVVGGVGGAYYGGIAGGVIGAIKGTTNKASNINADERMASGITKNKQIEQMQQMAAVREQAADQFTRLGYQQGLQDGQVAVMQQLQQAALAEQEAAAHHKPGFVDKLAKERGVDAAQLASASHADHAKASKEAASHAVQTV